MQYKVVPLNRSKNPPAELDSIIQSEASDGWKYVSHQYSHYLKPGTSGCFGIGAQPDMTLHVGMVVFEKQ